MEIPTWFETGMKFRGRWIANGNNTCEIISFCATKNLAIVKITTETSQWTEDDWNLQHTIGGFNNMDYIKLK